VSERELDIVLRGAGFPESVATYVVETYKGRYGNALAVNRGLGSARKGLVGTKLEANSMKEMLLSGSTEIVDRILSTRESRDVAVHGIATRYALCYEDQLRLVSRALSPRMADYLLRIHELSDEAEKVVAHRASEKVLASWLDCHDDMRDDMLFPYLQRFHSHNLLVNMVIPTLSARRGLRSRALFEGPDVLRAAACWTELETWEWESAATFASGYRDDLCSLDPILGLLSQPSCPHEIRERLLSSLTERQLKSMRHHGFDREDRVYVEGPIRDIEDRGLLDNLLVAYSDKHTWELSQVARRGVLMEISWNKSLSNEQKEKLARVLCTQMASLSFFKNRTLLGALTRSVGELTDNTRASLARYGMSPYAIKQLENGAGGTTARMVLPEVTAWRGPMIEPAPTWGSSNYTDRCLSQLESIEVEKNRGVLASLSRSFRKELGDGDRPASLAAWRIFLGLVEHGPDAPTRTLLESARLLGAIEVEEILK
jgi:hypothetical protein